METITGGGSFTNKNIAAINRNFNELSGAVLGAGPTFWVRPQAAISSAPSGAFSDPFPSFTALSVSGLLVSNSILNFEGVTSEQWTTPLGVNNVTIQGASVIPRQATTSGVPNGAGATWLAPSNVTTSLPLIRVQGQGWTIANIYFNSTGITTNGCIEPYTTGDPPTAADGAHLLITNCILTGAKYGIRCPTGTNFVRVVGCEIFGYGDSGDVAISGTGGVGTLLDWQIVNCKIYGNANGIVAPFNKATISGCSIDSGTATINLTSGTAPNRVIGNSFNIDAADFDPAGGVTGVTGDIWSNTLKDAIETGLPAN